MQSRTAGEAVSALYSEGGPYFSSDGNARLWVHDLIHTILYHVMGPEHARLNTSRSEELAGLYQAVVTNDPRVSTAAKTLYNGKTPLKLDTIKEQVMPGIRNFVVKIATKFGVKSRPALSDDEITEHYVKARVLARLVYEEFGGDLGDMQVSALKAMPFSCFETLLQKAVDIYDGTFAGQAPAAVKHRRR